VLADEKKGVRHFSRFSRSGYPHRWHQETSYAAYIGLFHHRFVVSAITAAAGLCNYARAMRHQMKFSAERFFFPRQLFLGL